MHSYIDAIYEMFLYSFIDFESFLSLPISYQVTKINNSKPGRNKMPGTRHTHRQQHVMV